MHYSNLKKSISAAIYFLFIIQLSCFLGSGCTRSSIPSPTHSSTQKPKPMNIVSEDAMVQYFYANNGSSLFWFSSDKNIKRANEWLDVLDSAAIFGLDSDKIEIELARLELKENNKRDTVTREWTDQLITGLVLNFMKELQEGIVMFDFDEVRISRDSVYTLQLLNSKRSESVKDMIARLDCKDPDYVVYKRFLHDSLTADNTLKYKTILLAMNYRRYITLNNHSEYVVANIPETEVEYFRNDKSILKMRSVAGRKKNQTPTIASYITDIVSFPYWNVPFSIATKELLPKVQNDTTYLKRKNFEVVDAKGNVVDDCDLNWANYTEENFPYFFREATGPNNALGILKFNLQNPFSIFMHDTNSKWAFTKDYRFLSHGCIRLEKPVELAEMMAGGKIDKAALKNGKKDTESKIIMLTKKIPVFIIYMPVKVVGQQVTFLPDIYNLIKQG